MLFLDEGTAHLDKATEFTVMQRLLSLEATCVFTTHNREVLRLATRVLIVGPDGCRLKQVRRIQSPVVQKQSRIRSVDFPSEQSAVKPSVS